MRRRSSFLFLALAVASVLLCLPSCQRAAKGGNEKKPVVPVVVADVTRKDMPVIVRAIGRVTSPATVSVKPQVTGTLSEIHFVDGQVVKKGDRLVTIDRRPFEVALEQAKAAQAEAQTKAGNARDQAVRYGALGKAG